MLQLAKQLGCQLRPTPSNPAVLRGLCPFHQADSLNDANHPADKHPHHPLLMPGLQRPRQPHSVYRKSLGSLRNRRAPPHSPRRNAGPHPAPLPQGLLPPTETQRQLPPNTAILTRAARYYGQQLYTSHAALQFIAQLGIDPDDAVKAGIGYCPGTGLRQYLLDHGVTPEEMEDSPLFRPETGIETFTGNIALADRDFTGSTLWMTSTLPEAPRTATHGGTGDPTPTVSQAAGPSS